MRVISYPVASYRTARSETQSVQAALELAEASSEKRADAYADKLVKYIPGEVIAFYLPVYGYIAGTSKLAEWVVLAIGIIGTLVYLMARSDRSNMPRWYFFVLAIIAFICWAIGTSSVGTDLWGMPTMWTKIALASTIFLVPGIDQALTNVGMGA